MHGAPIKQKVLHIREGLSKNLKRVQIKKRQRHTLPQIAVPSAQAGLTSLFEMGRGEPRRNNHLKIIVGGCWFLVVGVSINYQPSTINCSFAANILTY